MADNAGAAGSQALFGRRDPVFRPWPLADKEPANIADFVRRVKAQGGEFRKLTEESLRKEIEERRQQREAGDGSDGEEAEETSGASDEDDDETSGDKLSRRPKGIEAMIAKRDEVLRALESALQNGLIAVDFVSLLLSKDRPTQALQTLSPLLREKIGIGTLSAGRVANAAQAAKALQTRHGRRGGGGGGGSLQILDETTRSNAQRVLDHKIECVGWQLLAMDRAAEVLAAGRKRLHAELRREQVYWSEVVAVRDRGWGLSRMPGQRRVLRVKFGFSEAAADLRAAGFAPLRRVRRGHVALDMSALGVPSAVVVTLRRTGHSSHPGHSSHSSHSFGRSSPPARLPDTAPLENRILEARNTVFARELWRELNREARSLVAHGVVLEESQIIFPAGINTEGIISLQPLELEPADGEEPSQEHQEHQEHQVPSAELCNLAEGLSSALHLFLAYGHRHHYRQRSVPVPPTDSASTLPPAYYLLRPVLANLKYERAVEHIIRFLSDLCTILHAVGYTDARFTLYERPLSSFVPPAPAPGSDGTAAARQVASSEGLCMGFLSPREFTFELAMTPETRLSIRSRTTSMPLKTQYLVQLLPSPGSDGKSGLLQNIFPPADNYATLRDVVDYVGNATAHVLTDQARSVAVAEEAALESGVTWLTAVDGMAVHHANDLCWEMRFSVVSWDAATELDEVLGADSEEDEDEDEGKGKGKGKGKEKGKDAETVYDIDSPLQSFHAPELRLYASWPVSTRLAAATHRKWAWTAESVQQQQSPVAMQDILKGCINGQLRPATGTEE